VKPQAAISWGELLWDLFEHEERLGGCACNVAYHLAVLGQAVSLVSRVGDDGRGRAALERLARVGVGTELVQVDQEHPTGSVRVDVSNGEPRYTIVERVAWDRIALTEAVATSLGSAQALVFGTLAQRTPLAHTTMQRALELAPPACLKVCDLNLRRPFSLGNVIEASARAADVVKLNQDESLVIGEILGHSDVTRWLLDECGVRLVAETRGAQGALLSTRTESHESRGFPISGQGDTVGAGDAFCARLVVGLLCDEPLAELGGECNRYAARVASLPGATPAPDLLLTPE
jgi:fructokinase